MGVAGVGCRAQSIGLTIQGERAAEEAGHAGLGCGGELPSQGSSPEVWVWSYPEPIPPIVDQPFMVGSHTIAWASSKIHPIRTKGGIDALEVCDPEVRGRRASAV